MPRKKEPPKHKQTLQRLVLKLAARIESGKTTAKQEKDAREHSWIFSQVHRNLKGYKESLGKKQRGELQGKVDRMFAARDPYNDLLKATQHRLRQGETLDEILAQFDNAIEPIPCVQEAPSDTDESEDEQEEKPCLHVVKHAPVNKKKLTTVEIRQGIEPYIVEGLPLQLFTNLKSGYNGRERLGGNCFVSAFLNIPVHMFCSNEPNPIFHNYVSNIANPDAKAIYNELRRTKGVLTKEVYSLRDAYVKTLRELPTYDESMEQLQRDHPSSTFTRVKHCRKGCGTSTEEDVPLKIADWTALRALMEGDTGEFYCTTCAEDVEGDITDVLPERVLVLNIPKRNMHGKKFFKTLDDFMATFPPEATLGEIKYKRLYTIFTLKNTEQKNRHRVLLHDPKVRGGRADIIDSNNPFELSIPSSDVTYNLQRTFSNALKVVYVRMPRSTLGAARGGGGGGDGGAGGDGGEGLPRLRPRK